MPTGGWEGIIGIGEKSIVFRQENGLFGKVEIKGLLFRGGSHKDLLGVRVV